ncbi:hypothetical protein [Flavobacterium muglaense]|uniref:Pentapeptide repeat-containing protein n=1 Tax=Flavobacterium muglaense TaxID=2764716 RepID=A0A923N2F7_9FLAO|nr:hypothetical protein [Flavobacterium muglaense]MBC5837809.1 hypothetical protein [Flavobacterium muglaense]MBC5844433.1 hypothetical protein [Flavobacterium muglaense]
MSILYPIQEFYKQLRDNDVLDKDIITDYEVILDQSVINWQHRIIKKIIFKEKVVVRDVEINSGFVFENCKFEKGIVFHNVKSINYNSSYNKDSQSLSFINCEAEFIAFENKCVFARSVVIKDNSIINKINIRKTIITNGGFNIRNSTINYLDVTKSSIDLHLNHSIFNQLSKVESLDGDISLVSNVFHNSILFWNIECKFSIVFNYNTFKDTCKFEACRIKKLAIIGDTFEKKAELENRDLSGNSLETYLNKLYISEAKFIGGFDFNGLGGKLENLDIIINPELNGVLKFEGWEIDNTYITGVNQNLKLLFKRMSFRFIVINAFTNYSDISFDKCKGYGDSTLNLHDCDLGATKFNEFSFDTFIKLRFDNVTLDKIKLTTNKWFEDKSLEIEIAEQTEEERFRRKREIYRQLKQALKNSGNQIDSLFFQAREMECYRNELKQSKNYRVGDKTIMSFSSFNDFGLNWVKPVLIVFFSTLFIYILILAGISDEILFSFSCNQSDISNTFNVINSKWATFWNLFNPARRTDLTYGEIIQTDWIYAIDLFHRIFLAIMIFQIIKAFRKHVSN